MALSASLLREVEKRFDDITREREEERRRRGDPARMGSYAEDAPFLHFLHGSEEEQLRVVREVLGIDPEDYP